MPAQRRAVRVCRRVGIHGRRQNTDPKQGTSGVRRSAFGAEELQMMNVKLRVWRQRQAGTPGQFETYEAKDINPNMSFLEMLDVINDDLTRRGQEPIAFDHDCREGICGMCSCVINGEP